VLASGYKLKDILGDLSTSLLSTYFKITYAIDEEFLHNCGVSTLTPNTV